MHRGSAKHDLLTKAADVPEQATHPPDVGTLKTDVAKSKFDADGKSERRWSRKKRFGKRSESEMHVQSDPMQEMPVPEEHVKELEPEPEPEPQPEPEPVEWDVLRTARISKRAMESEITFVFPEVKYTPFGHSWAMDSFALLHNAIRAELKDLFHIGTVMQRRQTLLTLSHIGVFYEWWADFQEFVLAALDIEEEVYFPWVASKDYLRGCFKRSERMRINGATRNAIANISEYRDKFVPSLPVGERLHGLLEYMMEFTVLVKHHEEVASSLPGYLETLFKQKEKDANTKEIVSAFRMSDGYDRNLVLLSRWMPDRAMKRWAFSHIRSRDLLHFRAWRGLISREHCSVAARFEDMIMEEEEDLGAPVIGAAMAINEEMRAQVMNNRSSVKNMPNGQLPIANAEAR